MLFCTFCQLKAFMQKGCISLFGPIFIPTESSKILAGWLVLTWKALLCNLFLLICAPFSRNNISKKTQLCKQHLYEQIFWRWILARCELKRLLLVQQYIVFSNRCFGFWNKWRNRPNKQTLPILYRTGVTSKQIHICPIQRLNHLC